MTTDPVWRSEVAMAPRRRARRRHSAAGARLFIGSLSAAAVLGLMSAMAQTTGQATDSTTAATVQAPATPTVLVIRQPVDAPTAAASAAPRVAASASLPVTSSQGS